MKILDKTPAIRDLADRIMRAEVGARIRVVEGSFNGSLKSRSGTMVREGSADVDRLIRVVDDVFSIR